MRNETWISADFWVEWISSVHPMTMAKQKEGFCVMTSDAAAAGDRVGLYEGILEVVRG